MSREIRVLDRGASQPRVVTITRFIALRLFCDCHRHLTATRRDSWVYLVSLDRDDLVAYVKHSQDPESAPWSAQAMDASHEIKVCGVRLALPEQGEADRVRDGTDAEVEHGPNGSTGLDVSSADADVRIVPWWDRSDEAEDPNRRRELEIKRALEEWKRKKAEGWAGEDDKPKISPYMEKKLAREAAERAQHGLDLPDPNTERMQDLDADERK